MLLPAETAELKGDLGENQESVRGTVIEVLSSVSIFP